MSIAQVRLWGKRIGAVAWDAEKGIANFEYEKMFVNSSIEVSPLMMPLSSQIYSFPGLSDVSFYGLPGLLADSLPDKFGNALLNRWVQEQGRKPESFNSVERLCYIGKRGIGALEFFPDEGPDYRQSRNVDVAALVELASEILTNRDALRGSFSTPKRKEALEDILRVGTSAGGARAKAVIAWNPDTNEVRSGQVKAGKGFSNWLLKFDGVSGNKDKELDDSKGYGLIEYAYHNMALAAGMEMSECRLLKENGRSHFMTRRFDRTDEGDKIHMQSLGALAHYDFNQAGAYSYEQAMRAIFMLNLPMKSVEQQFCRTVFNILARNQDDHVKNIAFLMNRLGEWSLSPAFDITYSYNRQGDWTNVHQMSMNGKRDNFEIEDFLEFAKHSSMKKNRAIQMLEQVHSAVLKWPQYAEESGISENDMEKIAAKHRKDIVK